MIEAVRDPDVLRASSRQNYTLKTTTPILQTQYYKPMALSIWSMVRDGSAQPASPTIFAGTPATVTLCGTGLTTTEPAAMRAQWPISMLTKIFAPAPISTPWRILG